jgi:hypothetical protein
MDAEGGLVLILEQLKAAQELKKAVDHLDGITKIKERLEVADTESAEVAKLGGLTSIEEELAKGVTAACVNETLQGYLNDLSQLMLADLRPR